MAHIEEIKVMKIKEFEIQTSTRNKQLSVLIAIAEDGTKWVVSGDCYSPTYLTPYEAAFDTTLPK